MVLFYFVFQSFHLEWIILPNTNNPHSSFSLCLLSSCPIQRQTFPLSPPRLASIVYPILASDVNLCLYLHRLFITLQLISKPFLIQMQLIQVVGCGLPAQDRLGVSSRLTGIFTPCKQKQMEWNQMSWLTLKCHDQCILYSDTPNQLSSLGKINGKFTCMGFPRRITNHFPLFHSVH